MGCERRAPGLGGPTHRPPAAALEIPGEHDYLTEVHPQAEAFVRTVGERLRRGAAFFIDYGFPEHEYYRPPTRDGHAVKSSSNTLWHAQKKQLFYKYGFVKSIVLFEK